MGEGVYLDTILVPLSLFITIVYHAFLFHTIKNKPSRTTYGIDRLRRNTWGLNLNQVCSVPILKATKFIREVYYEYRFLHV